MIQTGLYMRALVVTDGLPTTWTDNQDRSLIYHVVEQMVVAQGSAAPDAQAKTDFLSALLTGLLRAGVSATAGTVLDCLTAG